MCIYELPDAPLDILPSEESKPVKDSQPQLKLLKQVRNLSANSPFVSYHTNFHCGYKCNYIFYMHGIINFISILFNILFIL